VPGIDLEDAVEIGQRGIIVLQARERRRTPEEGRDGLGLAFQQPGEALDGGPVIAGFDRGLRLREQIPAAVGRLLRQWLLPASNGLQQIQRRKLQAQQADRRGDCVQAKQHQCLPPSCINETDVHRDSRSLCIPHLWNCPLSFASRIHTW